MRDPGVYPDKGKVQWCDRRTSSAKTGEAVYSIITSASFRVNI